MSFKVEPVFGVEPDGVGAVRVGIYVFGRTNKKSQIRIENSRRKHEWRNEKKRQGTWKK